MIRHHLKTGPSAAHSQALAKNNTLYKLFDVARTREGPVTKKTNDEMHTSDLK